MNKIKQTNIRSCIGCREKLIKSGLTRFVVVDGELVRDESKKMPGRGCYLHENKKCWSLAIKKRAFAHCLKTQVKPESIEKNIPL